VGLEARWQRRWSERAAPGAAATDAAIKTFRLLEAIKLRQPPAVVWALVHPAESSLLLSPEQTAKAFSVPGTGPGLGEQQAHIDHEGQATIAEVIEFEEGRRAVTRIVSPKPPVPVRTVTTVEPLGVGSVLTIGLEFDAPASTVWTKDEQESTRDWATTYLDRVRRALNAETAATD
jgi:hypothetical protein